MAWMTRFVTVSHGSVVGICAGQLNSAHTGGMPHRVEGEARVQQLGRIEQAKKTRRIIYIYGGAYLIAGARNNYNTIWQSFWRVDSKLKRTPYLGP